jgi:hypothetical protein
MTLSFWMFAFAGLFWAVVQPWWDFDAGIPGRQVSLLGVLVGTEVPLWLPLLVGDHPRHPGPLGH